MTSRSSSIVAVALNASLLLPIMACGSEQDPTPGGGAGMQAQGGAMGGAGPVAAGGASSQGMSIAGSGTAATGGTVGTAGTGGAAGSAAGGSSAGSAIPATWETVKLVFGGGGGVMPCAAAPCHGVNGVAPPSRPLELPPNDDAQLYANLTSYVSKACGDKKLVVPGSPEQSSLPVILSGPCDRTPQMPYGCSAETGDCIPEEYVAALRQWIANGAPRP